MGRLSALIGEKDCHRIKRDLQVPAANLALQHDQLLSHAKYLELGQQSIEDFRSWAASSFAAFSTPMTSRGSRR